MIFIEKIPIPIQTIPKFRMTNKELLQFCALNKQLRIERDAKGNLSIMSPVKGMSGFYEGEVFGQLRDWNKRVKKGMLFSSATGFILPDTAMRSPDAAWVSMEKWQNLTAKEKDEFLPLCPEFIIEIRSKTDILKTLQEKMLYWLQNGAQQAWLLDPKKQKSYLYYHDAPMQTVQGWDKTLVGIGIIEGFELDLRQLLV